MANTFSGLTAFVNEQRNRTDFWLEALFANDVMPFVDSVGTVIPNVKEDTFTLPLLSGTVGIADGAACSDDFDNGNDTTITQSTVTLKKGLIQDSFCPHGEGYETYFTALGMPAGQHYRSLGIWQPYLIAEIQRRIGKRLAINDWIGDQSGDSWTYPGWYEALIAAVMGTFNSSSNVTGGIVGSSTPTAGGSAGTDAAGVFNICTALIEAAMYTQTVAGADLASDVMAGNVYIVMNPINRELMRQNYNTRYGLAMPEIATGLAGIQNDAFGAFKMPGYNFPVLTQAWIPQSTIILSRKGNQVIAFDLESDQNRLDIWLADDHDTIRWKARFKKGVAWRALNGSNLKYWGPTT